MNTVSRKARLTGIALAMSMLLPAATCTSGNQGDYTTMDKKTLLRTAVEQGVLEVLPPGAGDVVQAFAAMPDVTKGALIKHFEGLRTNAILEDDPDNYDWYDANLRCVNEGNCAELQRLRAMREAARQAELKAKRDARERQSEDSGGGSH